MSKYEKSKLKVVINPVPPERVTVTIIPEPLLVFDPGPSDISDIWVHESPKEDLAPAELAFMDPSEAKVVTTCMCASSYRVHRKYLRSHLKSV